MTAGIFYDVNFRLGEFRHTAFSKVCFSWGGNTQRGGFEGGVLSFTCISSRAHSSLGCKFALHS